MIVDALEIPEIPGEPESEEDPRLHHDAALLYLARALDGRRTAWHCDLAASCLARVLAHPRVASWKLARSYALHDLGVAHLVASEVARGARERALLVRARDHFAEAARLATGAPMRHVARTLHNLGYAYERLAELDEDEGAAERAAWALEKSRAVYALANVPIPAEP